MSNLIRLKRSSVPGKVPLVGDLALGELAINTNDGKLFLLRDNGTQTVVEVGGGGGGSVPTRLGGVWQPVLGQGPIDSFEYDEQVLLFAQGAGQSAVLFVRVPSNYVSGSQIRLRLSHYSPGATNNFRFQVVTALIRRNQDAVTSTANQNTFQSVDQALSLANQYRELTYDLTSSGGQINSISVSSGDLLRVVLSRIATVGTDDSNDVRMIPSSTEVVFA
jgi:hypothetical protein